MFKIRRFPFDRTGQASSVTADHGSNWPVIYLINGADDIYIGETTSFERRFREHLRNRKKRFSGFTEIRFAYDGTENKSSVLDYESNLIRLYSADGKFRHVLNANPGQSQDHEYHQRSLYGTKVQELWDQLHALHLTRRDYQSVRNSALYKFSPFTSMTPEQRAVMKDVLEDFLDSLKSGKRGAALVNGGAGTGKSLVAVKIIDMLLDVSRYLADWKRSEGVYDREWRSLLSRLERHVAGHGPLRIAYVAPMQSFNADMQKAFGKMPWKNGRDLVHNTSSIVSQYRSLEPFDIILVDEAHRLKHRKGMGNDIGLFDENRRRLGLAEGATQLDIILSRSKYSCLFYDPEQSVKDSDITPTELQGSLDRLGRPVCRKSLSVQMRCQGGDAYMRFVDDVLSGSSSPHPFDGYDFRVYDDVRKMMDDIRSLDRNLGLCRTVAGFAWPWKTREFIENNKGRLAAMGGPNRGKNAANLLALGQYDISAGQERLVWNIRRKGWVTSPGAPDEVGCIHTTQGYDLNYCGVILGPDIRYDKEKKTVVIEPSAFCDPFFRQHRKQISESEIRSYIRNAYRTMMLRGIFGSFVYAVDDDLREFLHGCASRAGVIHGGNLAGGPSERQPSEQAAKPASGVPEALPGPVTGVDPDRWFGKKVASLRRAKGISQEELAFRAGINRSYMGVIERGEKSPSIGTIAKVAKGLGVGLGDLFDGEGKI